MTIKVKGYLVVIWTVESNVEMVCSNVWVFSDMARYHK